MLNKPDAKVVFDDSGKAIGVSSEGETAKAPIIVGDPSYFADKCEKKGQVVRAICILVGRGWWREWVMVIGEQQDMLCIARKGGSGPTLSYSCQVEMVGGCQVVVLQCLKSSISAKGTRKQGSPPSSW